MKKYLSIMGGLFLVGVLPSLNARELDSLGKANYLYVEPDEYTFGENNTVEVFVCLDNETDDFNSFEMNIHLPDGFSIPQDKYGFYIETNAGRGKKTFDHGITMAYRDTNGDGVFFYRLVGTSLSSTPIETGDDWLFKFTVQAPDNIDNLRAVSFPATIDKIGFAAKSNIVSLHEMPDINFSLVNQNQSTGVDNVKVDGVEVLDGVYDLYGRRYDNAENLTPGVYVVNGVKQLIK